MSNKLTAAQEYLDNLIARDHMHYGAELETLQKALNAYNDGWRDIESGRPLYSVNSKDWRPLPEPLNP